MLKKFVKLASTLRFSGKSDAANIVEALIKKRAEENVKDDNSSTDWEKDILTKVDTDPLYSLPLLAPQDDDNLTELGQKLFNKLRNFSAVVYKDPSKQDIFIRNNKEEVLKLLNKIYEAIEKF